jgi:hypothetical protein
MDPDAINGSFTAGTISVRCGPCLGRGTINRMWGSIWIVAVYLLSISLFRWLGGIGAAADAIQRWGHAVGERRRRSISSTR